MRIQRRANLATVDPGLGGTGVAIWRGAPNPFRRLRKPWTRPMPDMAELVLYKKSSCWLTNAFRIADAFRGLLRREDVTEVWLEDQAVWLSTRAALASALRGDMVKLAHLSGMLAFATFEEEANVNFLPVSRWKGQLPKSAVHSRIRRVLGVDYAEHVADAVGMGLHLQGYM